MRACRRWLCENSRRRAGKQQREKCADDDDLLVHRKLFSSSFSRLSALRVSVDRMTRTLGAREKDLHGDGMVLVVDVR